MPFPLIISILFALQINRVATPVQLNSATELNEVLTDLGGVVIIISTQEQKMGSYSACVCLWWQHVYTCVNCVKALPQEI